MSAAEGVSESALQKGVVTFLDILGWRGIWQRPGAPLVGLRTLMDLANETMGKFRGRGKLTETGRVLCVSDTIVLVTDTPEGDLETAVEIHGAASATILRKGLTLGLPLRGATAYGDLSVASALDMPSAYGPAIDEAAAWHERCDWIGVHLTPSALFGLGGTVVANWVRSRPPLKDGQTFDTLCVDWRPKSATDHDQEMAQVMRDFLSTAPIVPSVLSKYVNTLRFLESGDV